MMSNVELRRLAEKVVADHKLPLGSPSKTLARAILSMDDPGRFIRNMSADDARLELKPETVTAKRGY